MTVDIQHSANSQVVGLTPYQPGKPIDELQRELGLTNIIKLASNENPLGASPKALAAVQLVGRDISLYPDGNGFALKTKLAAKLSVATTQLTLGNGSEDVLSGVFRAFVAPKDEVIISEYSFAAYNILATIAGAKLTQVKANNWGHDLADMAASVTPNTKLIIIANPNNPTGTYNNADEIEKFLASIPKNIIIVVDQAYVEYIEQSDYPQMLQYLIKYPNLIITRTFSKVYGLAGLRVGYGISSTAIADLLNRVRQPFNVNSLALCAATAALDDVDFINKSVELNNTQRKYLEDNFARLDLEYIKSLGNFISVNFGKNSSQIFDKLLHKGIIVRPLLPYNMPDYLRITVGLDTENQRLISALKDIL